MLGENPLEISDVSERQVGDVSIGKTGIHRVNHGKTKKHIEDATKNTRISPQCISYDNILDITPKESMASRKPKTRVIILIICASKISSVPICLLVKSVDIISASVLYRPASELLRAKLSI